MQEGRSAILQVPLFDPIPQYRQLESEIHEAIRRVLESGWYYLGPEGEAFEAEVAGYLGVKHAVGVNSGTDALVIGLRALGIGPGDEVITSPFTFFATAEAILLVGATPVFCDIDPDTFNLSPAAVEAAITPRTKAIIPVHLFGHAAAMHEICELAKRYRLAVLEDGAQAFGARLDGRFVGTLGDAGAFSFFPTKNLSAYGDGGLLVTDRDEVAELARRLRMHGTFARDDHREVGYNSRLDEIHAAILRLKLRHIEAWNAQRRQVAAWYAERLRGVEGVRLPVERAGAYHVYGQYTVRIGQGRRDAVFQHLEQRGIRCGIYYRRPLHVQPVFRGTPPSLPHAEAAADEVLSLPIWPGMEEHVVDRVTAALQEALAAVGVG